MLRVWQHFLNMWRLKFVTNKPFKLILLSIMLFCSVKLIHFIAKNSRNPTLGPDYSQFDKHNDKKSNDEKIIFSESDINTTLSPTDPLVLQYLRKYHLHHKSPTEKYNLTTPENIHPLDSYVVLALKKVLKGRRKGGFFIECGANDGEFLSNTIALEMHMNWTGLLIEGSPTLAKKLISKRRNAWVADVCLSGKNPEKVSEQLQYFDPDKVYQRYYLQKEFLIHNYTNQWSIGGGKISPVVNSNDPEYNEILKQQNYLSDGIINCFPLYSLLTAINVTSVDFFSLDVEGHEYKILEAIPFNLIDIKVILVEHFLAPEGSLAIMNVLINNGYKLFVNGSTDYIFIK